MILKVNANQTVYTLLCTVSLLDLFLEFGTIIVMLEIHVSITIWNTFLL